ncbi:MAG: hypothetical protein HYW27_02215 [Candidatus Aenigmarchaeota archaeon]|nr:hypothetical protein [Candidatus Aenigmarchaeota archaeon]
MARNYEYIIRVDGLEVWRGKHPPKGKLLELKKKNPAVIIIMKHDEKTERKVKEWQDFVVKNRDIFEKISKGLEKKKRR